MCQKVNSGFELYSLRVAVQLRPMLEPFYLMCHKHKSFTFLIIWEEQIKKSKANKPSLTIEEVPELVWKPTFAQCQELLRQLHDRHVKLSDVDKYFEHWKDTNNLQGDIQSFSAAIANCKEQKSNTSWIPGLVSELQQYWLLCNARDTAEALISLRDKVKFATTHRFELVEVLHQEVIID